MFKTNMQISQKCTRERLASVPSLPAFDLRALIEPLDVSKGRALPSHGRTVLILCF